MLVLKKDEGIACFLFKIVSGLASVIDWEICVVVLLAFCCSSGKVGDCSYQHLANPNTSTVKYLLFGKHTLGDSTDVYFWFCLFAYRQYQGLSRYKPDKFNRKMLSKLVFRLLDRFNVDPGMWYATYCGVISPIKNRWSQFVFFHVQQGISAVIYHGEFQGLINDIGKQSW